MRTQWQFKLSKQIDDTPFASVDPANSNQCWLYRKRSDCTIDYRQSNDRLRMICKRVGLYKLILISNFGQPICTIIRLCQTTRPVVRHCIFKYFAEFYLNLKILTPFLLFFFRRPNCQQRTKLEKILDGNS